MTKRLGRGLAELIQSAPAQQADNFILLPIAKIHTGRFQPRTSMDDESLEELKASIRKSGVIEPIIVRQSSNGNYDLVAGERRVRASQAIGIKEVPALVKQLSDKEALEFSLIENIQRETLNPIDEANGYRKLLEEFGYTQEDVAEAVGKNRATVANMLRLLTLPEEIQQLLCRGAMSMGHAKALLGIEDRAKQLALAHDIVKTGLSVRQVEETVRTHGAGKHRRARRIDPQLKTVEDELRRLLGTKVNLTARKKGGRITIEYFSAEDLTRILQLLGAATVA